MFESLKKFWNETMQITEARWVVWLTLLLVLVVTGVYLVKLFRDFAFGLRPSEADRINDMRTLKEIGALNDAEYRRAREATSQRSSGSVGSAGSEGSAGSKKPISSGEAGESRVAGESVAFREVSSEDSQGSKS
jgi:hypothetical protein